MLRLFFLFSLCTPLVLGQSDGNPHGWDRQRRCDLFDYDPPCGVCEGFGGKAYGDKNEEIELSRCSPVATADEIDPETLQRPVWGTTWTLPIANEILIGPKNDPACFVVFPGDDSVGDLCYVNQEGSKYYDMENARAIKEQLDVSTILGTVKSTILHQGPNMWIVNHFPIWALGQEQCVCVKIREGGDSANPNPIYPIKYDWVDNLQYVGREIIGVEYLDPDALTDIELDHWAYGPHHVWAYPETGQILRMWQPFNGLQVYRDGVNPGPVDANEFAEIPPAKCMKGGATFRTGCDDDGYPIVEEAKPINSKDKFRAKTKVPRHDYKGIDFNDMSNVLNHWLNTSYPVKACDLWDVEELQKLQALFYLARHSNFDSIYQDTNDNRRLRHHVISDIKQNWIGLNELAANDKDPMLKRIRRDGHCHEAVMWFVHHLTEDMKQLLVNADITLPLLSHHRHDCEVGEPSSTKEKICSAYREQVTCADCHSDL